MVGHDEWLRQYDEWFRKTESNMVDATKYASSDSKDLKAADFVGKNLKVRIAGVTEVHFEGQDDKPGQDRLRLTFEGKEKGLVLNPSNTKALIDAYGNDTDKWAGHEVGLTTVDYTSKGFGHGWKVTPLDIEPPEFEDDVPF